MRHTFIVTITTATPESSAAEIHNERGKVFSEIVEHALEHVTDTTRQRLRIDDIHVATPDGTRGVSL